MKEKILEIIERPEKVVDGHYGRRIAQGLLSEDLILKIVYEEREGKIIVVTIYPGKEGDMNENKI